MARARARPRDEEASRERILATAARLFARYGSAGMSMQMLADEVGLHKSTLFHHFSRKEELLHFMVQEELGRILSVVEPLMTDDPPSLDHLIAVAIPEGLESLERRIFVIIGDWLDRARRAGVIRNVRVRHALVNLLGLVLFYPAVADDELGREILDADPSSPRVVRARKEELTAFLRGAFAP